jgi:sec-independent protein translocase protein TatB
MFDIGISEIGVIAVVALVVIGPERLPKVARTIGTLLGRAQRYVNDVKAEVNREMELEELRKLQTQMQDAARGIQEQVSTAGTEMQSAVQDMEKQLHEGVTPAADATEPAQPAIAAPESTAALSEPPPDMAPAAAMPVAAEPAHPSVPESAPPPGDKPAQSSLFPEHTIR